jgi:predicted MPP superfamily phosphohydrolase
MATPAQASETGSSPLTLSRDADVVARFGFGSDIHIGRSSGVYGTALEKFNHALQTYASLNVDAVGFSGDLTNNGKSSEYAELMNAISTNLPSSDKVILSMGNHETYDPGMAQASARFKSATGQDMNKLTSVNGIDVITLGPQNSDSDYRADYDFLHTALDSISSRQGYDPAQPIIVLTHHAVQNTA